MAKQRFDFETPECVAAMNQSGAFVERGPDYIIVYTGDDIPPSPVPEVVSQRQMWEELIERNMLDAAIAAVKSAGQIMENYFMRSNEYQRNHPKTAEAIALFGMTPEQGDDLFRLASSK